MDQLVL
jgi:hypothetical protein